MEIGRIVSQYRSMKMQYLANEIRVVSYVLVAIKIVELFQFFLLTMSLNIYNNNIVILNLTNYLLIQSIDISSNECLWIIKWLEKLRIF